MKNIVILLIAVCALQAQQADTSRIKKHIEYLGSDHLQGRGTGSPGSHLAAEYIAAQLQTYELTPLGLNNSYFQEIPMQGSRAMPESKLTVVFSDTQRSLRLNHDYVLYRSGAQTFIPNPLPLVFVGYGIIAPEFDYNDYQSVDVRDKIVVFLDGEPQTEHKSYFHGEQATIYHSPDTKQRLALARGARGSILVPGPDTDWQKSVQSFTFEHIKLAYSVSSHLSLMINPQIARQLFQESGYSLDELYTMAENGLLTSFPLASQLSFEGKFFNREFLDQNVAAMLPGSNPKLSDTYVLLTAHYDHLGIGPTVEGDSIYNGVFDNASGVAGLLEIARLFSIQGAAPQRSLVFLFLTGEEMGLLGSTYYTDHPLVPLYKTILNINIDGLALFETFRDVYALGSVYSSVQRDLQTILQKMNLRILIDPERHFIDFEVINRSDHFAFAKAGIPFLLLAEGLTYTTSSREAGLRRIISWNEKRYHTPFDDLNQELNLGAAVQHTDLIYIITRHYANSAKAPRWRSGSEFINARLQTIAEKR